MFSCKSLQVNKLTEELLGLKEKEKLGENSNKLHTMQGGTSMLSTNNKESSFSTMEVQQQPLGLQGRLEHRPQCLENNSSKSAQNQPTFSTNRPDHDGKFNEADNIRNKQAFKPQGMPSYPPHEEDSSSNHYILAYTSDNQLYQHQQQQQQELLQHFQPQYQCFRNMMGEVKLGSFEYVATPSAPLAQLNGSLFLDDYQFKQEDEGTRYLELATQA
ncbi:hypothetical protein L7F22_000473 [Adiantum nelumboides]|nr:hypothetical protein [Adiantum nelumboides]